MKKSKNTARVVQAYYNKLLEENIDLEFFMSNIARKIFDDFNSNFNDGVKYEPIYEKTDVDCYEVQSYAVFRYIAKDGTEYCTVSLYPDGRVSLHFHPLYNEKDEHYDHRVTEFDGRYEWDSETIHEIYRRVQFVKWVCWQYLENVAPALYPEDRWNYTVCIPQ